MSATIIVQQRICIKVHICKSNNAKLERESIRMKKRVLYAGVKDILIQ